MNAQQSWLQDTEPTLSTSPELRQVLAELASREPIFHRAEFGTSRTDFERMMAEDYWETGASGRRYSRPFVLGELEKRFSAPHKDAWETTDFFCRQLGPDVYLLTYMLLQNNVRLTRRSTIWQKTSEGWKVIYHQGTLVHEA